jgi:hypothetical protein
MDTSEEKPLKLRLIGVRMSGFKERYEEDLDPEKKSKHQVRAMLRIVCVSSSEVRKKKRFKKHY